MIKNLGVTKERKKSNIHL